MRAVVIEIHKNYCIAVTPDCKFVKQHVEQGKLEIGDEITIEVRNPSPEIDWKKSFAIAATAVIVIGFGSWWLFRVLGGYPTVVSGSEVVFDAGMEEKEAALEMVAEEEVEATTGDEASMVAVETEDLATKIEQLEDIPSGSGIVDADFYIDLGSIGKPIEVIAGNFLFLYWIAESEVGLEVFLTIEELDPELAFTGYIEIILLNTEGDVTSSRSFDFEEFKRGDRLKEVIPIPDNEGTINVIINGNFK